MSDDGGVLHPASLAAQALGWIDATTRAVVPPIHLATTYQRDPDNQYRSGRAYGRADNPGYDQPEALLARLEQGAAALTFASGMAAATAVFLALRPGDHVVAPKVMYWALRRWLLGHGARLGPRRRSRRHDRSRGAAGGDAAGRHPPGVDRDAGQSHLGDHRHRRRRGDRAWRRRAAGGRQHRGDAGADAAARAGGRYRHALGDEIPQRA